MKNKVIQNIWKEYYQMLFKSNTNRIVQNIEEKNEKQEKSSINFEREVFNVLN